MKRIKKSPAPQFAAWMNEPVTIPPELTTRVVEKIKALLKGRSLPSSSSRPGGSHERAQS